ncbi:MAG: class I SAM-dependent methyltransferase [Deltaproteobacteria bacterium]|nr:class I SAM-dependent methyltransferase [Deltaproteobacteria bacterium]MBI3389389.1 class I SAM-dependent methyltransferase [Deltaproteobacteria bacterium]
MATDSQQVDFEKVKTFIEHVFGFLSGATVSGMIYLGDRLGLYRALQGAGAVTSDELARKTGLNERWVREWLRAQAGAHLIEYKGDGRFELGIEATFVLAEENSPAFAAGGFCSLPQQFAVLEKLPEAFKTGVGLPYDALGPEGAVGIERFLAPWFRTFLVPVALPKLDGVVAKLMRGALVADVGCGAGVALLEMAKAYPKSTFHGYDISKHALARAAVNQQAAGVTNTTFHDARTDGLPGDAGFDFITTFDCLHDMAHPDVAIGAIRRALKLDGTLLIADINGKPTFEENLERNPMVAMMYGFSIMSCMSSALSEPGGAGLGTLGFTEQVAREMTAAAGFTRFTRHDFENPVNAYYEVRP